MLRGTTPAPGAGTPWNQKESQQKEEEENELKEQRGGVQE